MVPCAHRALADPSSESVETVLVDFHTHSTASDGALTPQQLLQRAAARGIDALALTDHDSVAGYLAIRDCVPKGLQLIAGTELSCTWGGANVHIVGLGMAPEHPELHALLRRLDEARLLRAETIASRLAKAQMPGALAGALAIAGASQIGRPHFAQWLVDAGYTEDIGQAFDRWLGRGKIGDVKTYWPTLAEVVSTLVTAGGIAVLAHPLKYDMTATKLRALCRDFAAAGGTAIEVISGRQGREETSRLQRLAIDLDLKMSVGSDFHRDWTYGPDLGIDVEALASSGGVWEDLT